MLTLLQYRHFVMEPASITVALCEIVVQQTSCSPSCAQRSLHQLALHELALQPSGASPSGSSANGSSFTSERVMESDRIGHRAPLERAAGRSGGHAALDQIGYPVFRCRCGG